MKLIPHLRKCVLPLLTVMLWLVTTWSSNAAPVVSGDQIYLNGKTFAAPWSQWQGESAQVRTGISDMALTQLLGAELLDTENADQQLVKWFSSPIVLVSKLQAGNRLLDMTDLLKAAGGQIATQGSTLLINTSLAKVTGIQESSLPWGKRLILDLDRPTPWRLVQQSLALPSDSTSMLEQEWNLTLDAAFKSSLFDSLTSPQPDAWFRIETNKAQTILHLKIPAALAPKVTTLPDPNRLVIDLRADALPELNIVWTQGLRWRQQYVNVASFRFPVFWLELDLNSPELSLKPIWNNLNTLVGTAPLIETAKAAGATAAINGGFFNRLQRLPLGAIRRDGRWLSSPILNRGAIAWNNLGQVKIGRLNWQETLTTSLAASLPILAFNSGYVQAGVSRYTTDWGSTYTPLNDHEVIVVVQNHQVIAQLPGGVALQNKFPIPRNGYLLAIRDDSSAAESLSVGTIVSQTIATGSEEDADYPQVVGAGPLLIQNHQVVLDPKAEHFSDAFIRQTAPRSAICTTPTNTLLIAAVHNRVAGVGPTLAELAQVMQQLGCVDALNLDGGSSTSLYLEGQLLDRPPFTAARVHNGLGVFLQE